MRLGILVTTGRHLGHLVGITEAALARGHEVEIFAMDSGVRLITEPVFRELSTRGGVRASFCDYASMVLGVSKEGLPESLVAGSQFNNASMARRADRMITL